MENLAVENKLVLALSKIDFSENDNAFIDTLISKVENWNYFYECAVILGVGALVSKNIKQRNTCGAIPIEILAKLEQTYFRTASRNIFLCDCLIRVLNAFFENQIVTIPLKGVYLTEVYYKDIGIRQMSDIDLLIKSQDIEKCIMVLGKLGFRESGINKTKFIRNKGGAKHLPTMTLHNVSVEIHYRVLIDDSTYSIDIEEYWNNAKPCLLYNIPTLALSPENLLQYLCIHLERHFNEGKMQLYQFLDIICVLKINEKQFDWDSFTLSCQRNNCLSNVHSILFLLHTYFSISFPKKVIQQLNYINNDIKFKSLFITFLKCNKQEISSLVENANIKNLRKIKGFGSRIIYILGDIFPSRTFMYHRYKIKQKHVVYVFYLLRLMHGVKLFIQHIFKKHYTKH